MSRKIIDKYLPIIRNFYPKIYPDSIKLFDDGYDHYVLVADDQAFRFPRSKNHGKRDRAENLFLKVFAKTSPVPVQDMESHTDPKASIAFQTYKFIPGIQLSKELAQTLNEQELTNIATDMGKFLTKLHSFPLVEAREMKMDELDPKTYWGHFERLLEKLRVFIFPLLSKTEQEWIEKLVMDYVNLTKDNPFEVKVTHSDLLEEHIIVDENTHKLNGIIDFSLRIADPANDFKYFDRYGDIFLKTVYENYPQVDKQFDKRRKFYAGYVAVINVYESIERKNQKMKDMYLKVLKEYITQSNP